MSIYEFTSEEIRPLHKTTFSQAKLKERRDLQRLLRANIAVVAPDVLVIAEEFGDWDESRRRIDLLGIDRDANLVVIELKRTEDGGHMELQAIRYAAMASTMTFDQAVNVFARHLEQNDQDGTEAEAKLLDFLEWNEPDEDAFAQATRIVLVSADFSRELTSSIFWLIDYGIDIRCVRLQPYTIDDRILVDIQQIIPLPEVAEYQVQIAEKKRKVREARASTLDWSKYDITLDQQQVKRLGKGRAIYQIFRYLVENGVAPENIAQNCGPRSKYALASVDGEVDRDGFCRLATEEWTKEGRKFESRRFFCKDDELVHVGGRTYAFSTQWGSNNWEMAMQNLCDTFADKGISFTRSDD